jgi:hypothetical protein
MNVGITMSSSTEFLLRNFAASVRVLGAFAAVDFGAWESRTDAWVVTGITEGTGIAVCATGA